MPLASKPIQPRIQLRPTSASSTQRPVTSSNPISIPKKHTPLVQTSQPSASYGKDVDMSSWDVLFAAAAPPSSSYVLAFLYTLVIFISQARMLRTF